MDGLLNGRENDLFGILNGIDTSDWDPETDRHLAATYSARTLQRRAANRRVLLDRFQLDDDGSPLLCVISRLTWQKGMDILAAEIARIVGLGAQLAVLGSGDSALEGAFIAAASRHHGRVGVVTGYDEALAHLLQGGADAILIPSRFEPCGLTQLYGLRYGCIPMVSRTGGLADTIIDANHAALSAGVATGFQFNPGSGDAIVEAVHRLIAVHRNRSAWTSLQRQAMKTDVSWNASASEYAQLFRSLVSSGE